MAEAASTAELQALLVKVPLFANIKPKMMQSLLEEVSFKTYRAGQILVRQGEFTETLLVVLSGISTAYRNEPDGSVENMGSFGVNDWFGEQTALSNQPEFATVKAEMASTFLVISAPLFKKLYTGGGSFRDLVDSRYRERALAIHLRTAPLFKGLERDVLKQLAKEAQLETIASGKKIAEEGKNADAVYLIRSGVVKEIRKVNGQPQVVAYYRDNSSFGERVLAEDKTWKSTFEAMTDVDVVKLKEQVFLELSRRDVKARTRLQETVLEILAQEAGRAETTSHAKPMVNLSMTAAVDLMVGKKVVQGGEALVIDLHKCTRCNACVEACVSVHEDRVPRLSKRGIRTGDLMLTSACYNCKIPECMMGCNYGAIRRDVNGAIHFIYDNCTGCTACETKCPYGVIRMANVPGSVEDESPEPSFLARILPFLFKKRTDASPEVPAAAASEGAEKAEQAAPKAVKVEKKAIKCDLCSGLPFEACVYNCPCGAIGRVDPNVLVN